ncbi:TetR/AcrR family transcriptional regulator [Curtobacterium sp. 9128]|uniref:TetR/AcrR family transcriptional regulator n=1 Tax=Curtobacterium sp. 9128 TaxID=1793722 RepID=UPI00119D64E6|nr:TetR/AcrR family transcriptional regulator [Curtobacterium sp. 9128]
MSSSDGTGTRGPYAKGVQRRQEILDRTLDVVAERGIDGTSLRAIGEAIGVSHAALTHYFESREALLVEVLRARDQVVQQEFDDDGGVADMVRAAEANVRVPGLVTLYTRMLAMSVEPGNEVAQAFFRERFAEGRKSMAADLRARLDASGATTDLDLEQVAALVIAASDGLQVQWLLDRDLDIPATIRLLERLLPATP